jgi:hypothetical protein
VLLEFVNVWLMVDPEPALAPEIPPLMVPIVHEKLLATEAVSEIFGPDPLQVVAVPLLVTIGEGLTVMVIVEGVPVHVPVVEVGVTMYSTVPTAELLGLVRT